MDNRQQALKEIVILLASRRISHSSYTYIKFEHNTDEINEHLIELRRNGIAYLRNELTTTPMKSALREMIIATLLAVIEQGVNPREANEILLSLLVNPEIVPDKRYLQKLDFTINSRMSNLFSTNSPRCTDSEEIRRWLLIMEDVPARTIMTQCRAEKIYLVPSQSSTFKLVKLPNSIRNTKSYRDAMKGHLDVTSKLALLTFDCADHVVLSRCLDRSNREVLRYDDIPLRELNVITSLANGETPFVPTSIRAQYDDSFFANALHAAGVSPRGAPLFMKENHIVRCRLYKETMQQLIEIVCLCFANLLDPTKVFNDITPRNTTTASDVHKQYSTPKPYTRLPIRNPSTARMITRSLAETPAVQSSSNAKSGASFWEDAVTDAQFFASRPRLLRPARSISTPSSSKSASSTTAPSNSTAPTNTAATSPSTTSANTVQPNTIQSNPTVLSTASEYTTTEGTTALSPAAIPSASSPLLPTRSESEPKMTADDDSWVPTLSQSVPTTTVDDDSWEM